MLWSQGGKGENRQASFQAEMWMPTYEQCSFEQIYVIKLSSLCHIDIKNSLNGQKCEALIYFPKYKRIYTLYLSTGINVYSNDKH